METPSYPLSAEQVRANLIEASKHSKPDISDLLEEAEVEIQWYNHDNWNGGQEFFRLCLQIQMQDYMEIENRLSDFQDSIQRMLRIFGRADDSDFLDEVEITPILIHHGDSRNPTRSRTNVKRVWGSEGGFRLFLSHLAHQKEQIAELKELLAIFGVRAFVAHEDIRPSEEWQSEILIALGTMHAFAAILGEGFRESQWTDQEVGFALARGVPIIPVQLATQPPHGFLATRQALKGALSAIPAMANRIVDTLVTKAPDLMRDSLAHALATSWDFYHSKWIVEPLKKAGPLSTSNKEELGKALWSNYRVRDAHGVEQVLKDLGVEKIPPIVTDFDDIPF